MKIRTVTTYQVPPRWAFVRIETDEGVVGWGEPVVEGRAATVCAAVEELSDYLVGKDPENIEDLWTSCWAVGSATASASTPGSAATDRLTPRVRPRMLWSAGSAR